MLVLIIAGIVLTILWDSLPVAVLTAALILYRAQRPGTLLQRMREAWMARQVAQVGEE